MKIADKNGMSHIAEFIFPCYLWAAEMEFSTNNYTWFIWHHHS